MKFLFTKHHERAGNSRGEPGDKALARTHSAFEQKVDTFSWLIQNMVPMSISTCTINNNNK